MAAVMVYAERKVAAFMQQRYGPYLVGPKGLFQPIADIVKLFFKEELRPKAADAFLFSLAPIISVAAAVPRVCADSIRRADDVLRTA
jgi:NADH-quinone oxidoreductase subunit H